MVCPVISLFLVMVLSTRRSSSLSGGINQQNHFDPSNSMDFISILNGSPLTTDDSRAGFALVIARSLVDIAILTYAFGYRYCTITTTLPAVASAPPIVSPTACALAPLTELTGRSAALSAWPSNTALSVSAPTALAAPE